jgi:hypothetical protein
MEQQKVIFEKDEDYILKRNIMYNNITPFYISNAD